MDFGPMDLDGETMAFWREVRAFLDEHLTEDALAEEWRHGDGYDPALHRALGARGWVAPLWPREEGGGALDPVRARILALELWYRGAPDKLRPTTVLIADSLRPWASPALLAEVLPRVAAGEVCLCMGITEPDCGSDAAAAKTRAERDGDGWVIDGAKMFTTNAHNAQYCYLVTRTNPDVPRHKGLTVFLVPLSSPGIEIRPVQTLGVERTNMVFYDGVRVSDHYRVGPADAGWRVLNTQLADEHGMVDDVEVRFGFMYSTTMRRLLDAVVTWARTPGRPGEGRPIDDPLTRLRLARVAIDAEVAGITPEPMQRINASELLIRSAADLLDLLGPAGLLPHGEAGAVAGGVVEHGHRWAQATAIYGGTTDIQRNIIAEQVLGLPRHRQVHGAAR